MRPYNFRPEKYIFLICVLSGLIINSDSYSKEQNKVKKAKASKKEDQGLELFNNIFSKIFFKSITS